MKTTDTHSSPESAAKARRTGLLVHPDDLTVGKYYCVHSLKTGPNEPLPVAGQSFQVLAISLPFFVGQMVADPSQKLTFDVRVLSIMGVGKDFVEAQKPHVSRQD